MCRFVGWIGGERYIEDVVFTPEHSLVTQSKSALVCKTPVNADGFGLAWYKSREEPCIYKDTHPAWSDPNLKQLSYQTKAEIFLAHVRASTGTATSRNNCHPFSCQQWSFMHNGQAGGHQQFRQELDAKIPNEYYQYRLGATESEAIFLIAVGMGLALKPIDAMAKATKLVEDLSRESGITPHMRFSACWSDGQQLYAARYASDDFAPSLHYHRSDNGVVITSEPLDNSDIEWIEVKPNEALIICSDSIQKQEFMSFQ